MTSALASESVGDITTRYDPARRGRVIPMAIHHMKPMRIFKMGVQDKGPRPKGDLRPVEINRLMYKTCIVRHV